MFFRAHNSYKWRIAAALMVIIMIIPSVATSQEQQIVDIKVVGNDRITTQAIITATGLTVGSPLSESALQEAKEAIESMGFFQPGVTVGTESVEGGVRVIFTVVENPVVKQIKITGNTVYPTDKLLSMMRTSVGSVLNTNTLNQDFSAIEKLYDDDGYVAFISDEYGIDPETGVLTIPIVEATVESIRITGNKKTKDYVILRELSLKPGDVYNKNKLSSDIRRIFDLGIFEYEGTRAVPEAGSTPGKVIITLNVQERKTGELSLGLGYSNRTKLVGQAKLTESNFRGRGQTVNLLWEQTGDRGSSYEVGFFEPWLDKKHTSLGINLYNKLQFRFASSFSAGLETDSSDYNERHKGGNITLSRPFGLENRAYVTFRSESVSSNIENLTSPITSSGTVNSGTLRFTHDTRDMITDPYDGGYNSYAIELGTADFTALTRENESTFFTKSSIDLRRYFSKGGARVDPTEQRRRLALRLTAGTVTGNVPFFEQFFVGGAESLRGYREERFWGKNMLLLSAEYRIPMGQSLTGVLFTDYGDAWGAPAEFRVKEGTNEYLISEFTQHESFSPSLGYGLGIRVLTPIGPIRLDYGFGSEGSRAHFSIGHAF